MIPFTEWWHWTFLGLLCSVLEIFIPVGFFIGLGLAAFLMALIVFLVPLVFALPLGWNMHIFLYAALSLLSVFIMRRWFIVEPIVSDQPFLNQRGHQYLGRRFTLSMPIVNGQGKLRVDDTFWKVRGTDCTVGTTVVISGVEGVILDVTIETPANTDNTPTITTP